MIFAMIIFLVGAMNSVTQRWSSTMLNGMSTFSENVCCAFKFESVQPTYSNLFTSFFVCLHLFPYFELGFVNVLNLPIPSWITSYLDVIILFLNDTLASFMFCSKVVLSHTHGHIFFSCVCCIKNLLLEYCMYSQSTTFEVWKGMGLLCLPHCSIIVGSTWEGILVFHTLPVPNAKVIHA